MCWWMLVWNSQDIHCWMDSPKPVIFLGKIGFYLGGIW
jgi:hypothetical protein